MLKQLRKIFIIIGFTCFLTLNQYAIGIDKNLNALKKVTPEQMNLIQKDVKVNDLDIEPMNTQKVKKNVVPDTKKEGKKVLALFLKTMLGVALSAIILYFILLYVKKFHNSAFANHEDEELQDTYNLSAPNNRNEALRSFLFRSK